MKHRIDIVVPESELNKNNEKKLRLEKTRRFEKTDRAPVVPIINEWFANRARGVTFERFAESPEDHLRELILNYKWKTENILSDAPVPTERVTFSPNVGCLRGVEFPYEIIWPADRPPKTVHMLREAEDIDRLAMPDPWDNFSGRTIKWYLAMKDRAGDYDLRVNGERVEIEITITQPGGPIPNAFALAGENLFLWMLTDPDRYRKLMELVTKSHMNCIKYLDELTGRGPIHPQGLGADTAELVGAGMFEEFIAPYYEMIWEKYPGWRSVHNCGKIDHLLAVMRDVLKIEELSAFGFPADREKLGREFGGRVYMTGGPNPVALASATREEIIAEAVSYIKTAGAKGGFVLQTGGDAVPGTPPEKFEFMREASVIAANE